MQYRRNANTVERKIYFFRADIGSEESGQLLSFDPSPALNVIDHLPFTNDDGGRYEFDSDGNALCLLDHRLGLNPFVRFCRVRRTGLPQLEQAGQITDLDLASDTGLLEAIHVVFFPNNIVGTEYNHYGPRLSRLGGYLHDKSNRAVPKATFRALLRHNAVAQLDRLTEIRVLDMSIRPAYVAMVRQANQSLGDAFLANSRVLANPETVQLVIKPQRESRRTAWESLRASFRRMLNQNEFTQNAHRFQIRGTCADTDRVETIDLLKDHLISAKEIVRMGERSRALDQQSAFQAIGMAYDELEDDLHRAAGIAL